MQRTRFPLAADLSRWVEKFLKSAKIKIKTKFIEERDGNNFKRAGTQTTIRRNNFKLNFDSKTSILAISEKQNAVKMGINEKRDVRFVKNVVSRVI